MFFNLNKSHFMDNIPFIPGNIDNLWHNSRSILPDVHVTDWISYQKSYFAKFLPQIFYIHTPTDASVRHFVGEHNPCHTT